MAGTSKISNWLESDATIWLVKIENYENFFYQSRLFIRHKIVLSKYQAIEFEKFDIEEWNMKCCCKTLIKVCVQKLQTFATFTLFSVTLQDYIQLWFWNSMLKPKCNEGGTFTKNQRQKFQRLFSHGADAYDSVRVLSTNYTLTVSNVSQFSH